MAKNDENEHFSGENPKIWGLHLHNSIKKRATHNFWGILTPNWQK